MRHTIRASAGLTLAILLFQFTASAAGKKETPPQKEANNLPKVLIIGDSISMGYTRTVIALLKDKANVSRVKGNCAHSGRGVKSIKKWLGTTKWDVIHFNFGIWDTHFLHNGNLVRDLKKHKMEDLKRRFTTEQHIENLTKIIAVMKTTGAKLVWASTTPFVSYGEDTKLLVAKNNKAGKQLMIKEGVAVNDLYALALPNLKAWQSGDGCHFKGKGSKELAKQVASSITTALGSKVKSAKPVANK